jgi:hypothetical protein
MKENILVSNGIIKYSPSCIRTFKEKKNHHNKEKGKTME